MNARFFTRKVRSAVAHSLNLHRSAGRLLLIGLIGCLALAAGLGGWRALAAAGHGPWQALPKAATLPTSLAMPPDPNGPVCTNFTNKTKADGLGNDGVNDVYAEGSTVYAATSPQPFWLGGGGGGLSISTDGGNTFTTRTTAQGLSSNNTSCVFAAGSMVYVGTVSGLSISTDGGASFTNKTTANGLGDNNVLDVYAAGNVVYVATGSGLAISTDGGNTFTNQTPNPNSYAVYNVYAVGNAVYAGGFDGLAVSTDGGASFTVRTTADGLGHNYILSVYAEGSTVYAATASGLSISTDGGTSFTNRTTAQGLPDDYVLNVYARGSTVYAGTFAGLAISTDGGASFTNYTTASGLGSNLVRSIFATATNIYAATAGGLSFCLPSSNTLPTISAVANSRQQGVPASASTIATVGDADQSAGSLTVTVNGGASATVNGVTVSGITNTDGTISATIGASCTASNASFTLEVTDSASATATAMLNFTVTANSAPTLGSYPNAGPITVGGGTTVTPSAAPADNVSVTSVTVAGSAGFTGTLSVNPTSGVVAVSNAGPAGMWVITVTATDNCGAPTSSQFTLTVNPPNTAPVVTITGPASGSIYPVGTPVNFTGTFTDTAGDTHTGNWMFDTITQAATIIESSGSTPGSANKTYTFTQAGVYLVKLTVTDNGGLSGVATTVGEFDAMVVIYDPSAGWVTGGGWINSPAGAYTLNPSLTGKANFGFVSKYQNGASAPTGNTEFQFKAGNLNFKSTSYEWLVVAGARAQYKGVGTINGSGSYRFMLTCIDGDKPGGGGADKFRIRIWSDGGGLVYDNQLNAPDNDAPTTVLGGGSIVIHN